MIVEIDKNGELVIKSETTFEELYISNWYKKNKDKPSKEVIILSSVR